MTPLPGPWVHPEFRLMERNRAYCCAELCVLADRIRAASTAPTRFGVGGDSVATLVASLMAADAMNSEVVLQRRGTTVPLDLGVTVAPDGQLTLQGPVFDTPGSFCVIVASSGTTGGPKLARHEFARLLARIPAEPHTEARWLLTFDPSTFGGLQVILTALVGGATLIADPGAAVPRLADAAIRHGATHISATPSFWRAFLLAMRTPPPLSVVTLGGEAADQALLDKLCEQFPDARIGHLYASTEAGALFMVRDRRAGFPASWLEQGIDDIGLRVRTGVLEVRSPRMMLGYLGNDGPPVSQDGWLVTGDLVELAGDRVVFTGRADDIVNIGGVKVRPEKVERVIRAVPGVFDAAVSARPSPITGHILTATVVPAPGADPDATRLAVRRTAEERLSPAERPRIVDCVDQILLTAAGKKNRAAVPATPL